MEGGSGMPGGILPSSMTSAGLLGLDTSLHQHQQQQQQLLLHQQPHLQHQMLPFQPTTSDGEVHQPQHPSRQAYLPSFGSMRGKQHTKMSSEEEPGFTDDGDETRRGGSQPSPSPSPWQRMKWTDSMVRLLISAVYHVGDDATDAEQQATHGPAKGKKAASSSSTSALLQKKGKWKSVSRAMMEKGFYVSPQQCEDKFNDLNKRYKRVNDLLGKGTACRVVENHALLDSMDHLSPKAKEEARKLLNSKHLFFREMCTYHNAGGGGGSSSSVASAHHQQMPLTAPADQQQLTASDDQQQLCFHHPQGRGEAAPAPLKGVGLGGAAPVEEDKTSEEEDDDDDSDEDDDDYVDEDDEDDDLEDHRNKQHHPHPHQQHKHGEVEYDEDGKGFVGGSAVAKKPKGTSSQLLSSSSASPPLALSLSSPSSTMQQLRSELMNMAGGGEQQRQWIRKRAAELEEQRVGYQSRAFQLERQRFKWLRFSANKEREMERMKLHNDRLRLENDRMLLLLRQKEVELIYGNGGTGVACTTTTDIEQQRILQSSNIPAPSQSQSPCRPSR